MTIQEPIGPHDPIQEGVQHGPYMPLKADGFPPDCTDDQREAFQALNQVQGHIAAINRAEDDRTTSGTAAIALYQGAKEAGVLAAKQLDQK